MSITAWMPYYGSDFEGAMKGYRRELKWSYIAAIWHYWHHTHAKGLPDDDAYLKCVCECPDADWIRTKGVIFTERPFFYLEAGRWHQSRCREEWESSIELIRKREEASRLGVAARAAKGQIQPHVEPLVKPVVQPPVKPLDNLSTVTVTVIPIATDTGTLKGMELGAAVAAPTAKVEETDEQWLAGLKTDKAFEGINVDLEHAKMIRWCREHRKQPSRRRFVNWLNRCDRPLRGASQPETIPQSSGVADSIRNQKELERIEARLAIIRGQGSSVAGGGILYTPAQKTERLGLITRKNELIKLLGFKI